MKPIEIMSRDNPKIKFLKQLQQKKYRDKFEKFFVENAVLICDALKSDFFFESLFVTEDFIKKNKKKFDFILSRTNAKEYYLISEKINRSFSNLDTAPGICAIYHKKRKEIDFTKPIIYLNGINDPGNLGTILRSALAFDLKNIIVDEKCADIYNPKTISASKDAIFKLNIISDKNLEILDQIKEKMKVFSTRIERSDTLDVLKNEKLFCLILGSESHGIDKKLQEMSDACVRIEMGKKIESLNVASASAIIFYEIYKMRK
ncbi:RNA methyltransferase [Candidatus Parcubacteria bacterium]|nr:RNA methyltransferase [Candidatus Parcubacteria bacterium]